MNLWFRIEYSVPLLLGLSGYLLWFSWSLYPLVVALLVLVGLLMIKCIFETMRVWIKTSGFVEQIPLLFLFVFMLSNMVGVFLPETGFDALWYHLPLIKQYSVLRGIPYIPELYQSAMPRLANIFLTVPFGLGGLFLVKVWCYIATLWIAVVLWKISKNVMSKQGAMWCTALLFSFHFISWQASSVYVDQFRAVFELSAVLFCIEVLRSQKKILHAEILLGLLMGMSFGVKMVSVFFLPVFILICFLMRKKLRWWLPPLLAFFLYLPWMVQAYQWTGNAVFPLFGAINQSLLLAQEQRTIWQWIVQQALLFPIVPLVLASQRESYTSLMFIFCFPFLFMKKSFRNWENKTLWMYALASLALWILIPPLSVRYAFSSIALLFILMFAHTWKFLDTERSAKRWLLFACFMSLSTHLMVRIGANYKALPYLQGKISEQAYVEQFRTPLMDGPINKWYSNYWDETIHTLETVQ